MSEPILEIKGLNKSFGPVHVLHDVDFDVRAGEVTALVGDNGAGKSTLVKCIAGIHPYDSAGRAVQRRGRCHIHGPTRRGRPRHRGRLPGPRAGRQPRHRPEHVPRPRARQLVAAGRGRHGAGRPRDAGLAVGPHGEVGAHAGLRRCPVVSARPSPSRSRCCGTARSSLLDEPTAALGVAQTRQVLDLVRRLAEQGLGVVLISHNMADVFEVADRIATLYLGRHGRRGAHEGRHPRPGRRADHRGPLR